SNTVKGNQKNRKKVTYIYALIVFIIDIPSALSEGVFNDVQFFAGTVFDNADFLVLNMLLLLGAMFSSLFFGYIMDKKEIIHQLNVTTDSKYYFAYRAWMFLLKYVLPVIILFIFIANIINFF